MNYPVIQINGRRFLYQLSIMVSIISIILLFIIMRKIEIIRGDHG